MNKIINKFIISILGVSLIMPLAVFANHNIAHTIQQLLEQVRALQTQLNALQASQDESAAPSVIAASDESAAPSVIAASFDKNLYFGLRNDSDVSNLQEFLIKQKHYSGSVTGNFFILTIEGVKNFQQANGIKPTGYFGPLSRAAANIILQKIIGSEQLSIAETPTVVTPAPTPQLAVPATIAPMQPITSKPSITVLSPNGGEVWHPGETRRIQWNALGSRSIKIYIYDSNIFGSGSTNYITPNNDPVLASTGYYDWVIPALHQLPGGIGSTNYRIRIDDYDTPSVYNDFSNSPFSIVAATTPSITATPPSITVLSPNGGENWTIGSIQTINWTINGTIPSNWTTNSYGIPDVIIYLYKSGQFIQFISTWHSGGPPASFTVPNVTPGSDYTIRVSARGMGDIDLKYFDNSNSLFSIVAATPSITVLSPNGGEVFEIGKSFAISWSSSNILSDKFMVKLQNVTIDRAPSKPDIIGIGVSSPFLFSASSTLFSTGQYIIEVCDSYYAAASFVCDTSDAPFSINSPSIPMGAFPNINTLIVKKDSFLANIAQDFFGFVEIIKSFLSN